MKLTNKYFKEIIEGYKNIEIRLNDEKRKKVKIHDLIIFENLKTKQTLKVVVKKIEQYNSFEELYLNSSKKKWLSNKKIKEFKELIYKIYSKEEEDRIGVLLFEIEKI